MPRVRTLGIDAATSLTTITPAPRAVAMVALLRFIVIACAFTASAAAGPPAGLATALEYLRDQGSYSWEVINADPGPVAQQFQTRRGTVTTVQQNLSPHVKGQIDRQGDMLIVRQWADGLRLDTVITSEGRMVTKTPEGWLTDREILTAQAEERLRSHTPTPRFLWLRRADRPDVRRPDQELVPFLQSPATFQSDGDSYTTHIRSRVGDPSQPTRDESEPGVDVTVIMNVSNGVLRDYQVNVQGTRRVTRARVQVPISDQRIVVITYLPVNRIDIPEEAREKLERE